MNNSLYLKKYKLAQFLLKAKKEWSRTCSPSNTDTVHDLEWPISTPNHVPHFLHFALPLANTPLLRTRSIWKMLGPFTTASRLTPIHQVSPAVRASMSTTPTTTTTTTTRDRGDHYGPMAHGMGPINLTTGWIDYYVVKQHATLLNSALKDGFLLPSSSTAVLPSRSLFASPSDEDWPPWTAGFISISSAHTCAIYAPTHRYVYECTLSTSISYL